MGQLIKLCRQLITSLSVKICKISRNHNLLADNMAQFSLKISKTLICNSLPTTSLKMQISFVLPEKIYYYNIHAKIIVTLKRLFCPSSIEKLQQNLFKTPETLAPVFSLIFPSRSKAMPPTDVSFSPTRPSQTMRWGCTNLNDTEMSKPYEGKTNGSANYSRKISIYSKKSCQGS